jgi:hypothetical protein
MERHEPKCRLRVCLRLIPCGFEEENRFVETYPSFNPCLLPSSSNICCTFLLSVDGVDGMPYATHEHEANSYSPTVSPHVLILAVV